MWLLHTRTLRLEEFVSAPDRPYAILSHTWGKNEVSFRDMQSLDRTRFDPLDITYQTPRGYSKIGHCCRKAQERGYDYVWIDTCCINKESSAELSEAINSMYKWYEAAAVCYVYLEDFHVTPQNIDHFAEGELPEQLLRACRWFTRGWTLQELIAPRKVDFYNARWKYVGNKEALIDPLVNITRIDPFILTAETSWKSHALQECSVATKLSWAATRTTSREEDEAYALLGLFDIKMPLLYGEGRQAFRRLQENIIAKTRDHSILMWHPGPLAPRQSWLGKILAPSPHYFLDCPSIVVSKEPGHLRYDFRATNRGIEITCPLMTPHDGNWFVILNCRYEDDLSGPVIFPLKRMCSQFDEGYVMARNPKEQMREVSALDGAARARFKTYDVLNPDQELFASGRDLGGTGVEHVLLVDLEELHELYDQPKPAPHRVNVRFQIRKDFDKAFQL